MDGYVVILENNDKFIASVELNGEFDALDVEPRTIEPYTDFWERMYDNDFSAILKEVDSYEIMRQAYHNNPGRLIQYLPEDERDRVQRKAVQASDDIVNDKENPAEIRKSFDRLVREEIGDIEEMLAKIDRGSFVEDTVARYEPVDEAL